MNPEWKIIGQTFDQERALYNLKDTQVVDCIFAGPADGESALKESRDVASEKLSFFSALSFVAFQKFWWKILPWMNWPVRQSGMQVMERFKTVSWVESNA